MSVSLSSSADRLPSGIPLPEDLEQGTSLWKDAWHRLAKNKLAVFGGTVLIVLAIACIVGPWLSPYGYEDNNLNNTFSPPSGAHWLGTDQLGRDLLVRLLVGGRISIGVGLCATFVALTIGVVYGAVAGFFGGKIDSLMMRIVDIMYALPFTIFVIL
ncbi:MAG: ABC transporter permease, partial [Verrucomicrobiia bacterium]